MTTSTSRLADVFSPEGAGPRRVPTLLGLLLTLLLAAASSPGGDPYRSQQWWLDGMDVGSSDGAGALVAIVDSGVSPDHPDLVGRLARDEDGALRGLDLVDGGGPEDPHGHGTMVAGLVAAAVDNGIGIVGMAPGARILPVRVLDAEGRGTAERVAAGIRWAVTEGASVINVSLETSGGAGAALLDTTLVQQAITEATSRGVPVIVAAGNHRAQLTGSDPLVLVVGAHDRAGLVLPATGRGPDVVFAPGAGMVTTWCRPPDSCRDAPRYGVGRGSSFAAPIVTGIVARHVAVGRSGVEAVAAVRDATTAMADVGVGRRLPLRGASTPEAPRPTAQIGPAADVAGVTGTRSGPERDTGWLPGLILVVGVLAMAGVNIWTRRFRPRVEYGP